MNILNKSLVIKKIRIADRVANVKQEPSQKAANKYYALTPTKIQNTAI